MKYLDISHKTFVCVYIYVNTKISSTWTYYFFNKETYQTYQEPVVYCRSLQMQYSTWCERNTQSWPAAPHCYMRVTKAWRASSWPEVWHHFNRPVNYLRSSIRGEKAPLSLYVSSECGALYEIFSTLSPVKNQQTKIHINQKEFKEQSKTKMIYSQWRSCFCFLFFSLEQY